MAPAKIVILGAGFGGANVALKLDEKISQKINGAGLLSRIYQWFVSLFFGTSTVTNPIEYEITLISNLPFFHHNLASLRAMVDPEIISRMMIPLNHIFDNAIPTPTDKGHSYKGKFIQGQVTDVSNTHVTFESPNGNTTSVNKLSFDYLVIALGSSYAGCKFKSASEQTFKDYFIGINSKLKEAKSVTIIGGGPVGVELAGELATDCPEKKITIVHSESALINQGGYPTLQKRLENGLKSKGVSVVFNERVVSNPALKDFANFSKGQTITTDKGTKLETDVLFKCVGARPNSEPVATLASIIKSRDNIDIIESNGRICVNEYLQVLGTKNIFAIGDVNNVPELKLGYHATLQVPIIVDNILSLISNEDKALKVYKPSTMNLICVPLGRDGGHTQFTKTFVLGNWATRMIKSKDLLISKYWGILRAGNPSQ